MNEPSPLACPHCGLATADGAFCCAGCAAAAELLQAAGLGEWYEKRSNFAPRPGALASSNHGIDFAVEGAGVVARFHVEGLSCASCVWVAERLLGAVPGVELATVSYATGNAVVHAGQGVEVEALLRPLRVVGWTPRALHAPPAPDRTWMVRVGVAAFGAMNLMGIAAGVYAGWRDGMPEAWRALFAWWSLVVATPVATWCALPFYRRAVGALRAGRLHVDVPVSVGIVAMYLHGLWAAVAHREGYLDSMAMLVALLLGARALEARGRRRAVEAARALGELAPMRGRRLIGDAVEEIEATKLEVGDRVVVGLGEQLAVDGVVLEGEADLDLALVSGESEPWRVGPGEELPAGALVRAGNLVVRALRVGEETLIGRMARELGAALDRPVQATLADRVAGPFTAATLAIAALSALAQGWWRGPDAALATGVAVLVVACPCALALAAPLAGTAGLGGAARRGLLLRSADALRELGRVDVLVLDKTGTLTEGTPSVEAASDDVLRLAAGLERQSAHPIARAIVAEAGRRKIPLPATRAVVERAGWGVAGEVDGRRLSVETSGPNRVRVVEAGRTLGEITLRDRIRAGAREAIAALGARGVEVQIASGDRAEAVASVARELGVASAEGGLDPQAKRERVRALRDAGRRVCFVGDGVNDGVAITEADVGIAMGTGSAVSVHAADGVLVEGAAPGGEVLRALAAGIGVARDEARTVRRISLRALLYNVVAVAAAAAGLVNPLIAALSMPLSSLMVVASAVRVGRRA